MARGARLPLGQYGFDVNAFLIVAFILNSMSMLVPFAMPHLVRSRAKSVVTVLLVNAALVLAWGSPDTVPFVAAAFFGTYIYSFAVGGLRWLQSRLPMDKEPSHS